MKSDLKIVIHRDFDFTKVRFYTLKFEEDKKTQLDQFFLRYKKDYLASIESLKWWLANIGELRGAKKRYFRPEDNVGALPPPSDIIESVDFIIDKNQMNLRLYCIVLSEEIVILVNGGIKESQQTKDSPSCWKEYLFASNIASQIRKQMKLGNCKLNGKQIKRTKEFKLNYQRK